MKQITEDYVSYEIAKLLKEKGFDEPCIGFYNPIDGCFFESCIRKSWDYNRHGSINAPTLQMALKWLMEVHGLYVNLDLGLIDNEKGVIWSIVRCNNSCVEFLSEYTFEDTYEQAVEAAIKYCLENLI